MQVKMVVFCAVAALFIYSSLSLAYVARQVKETAAMNGRSFTPALTCVFTYPGNVSRYRLHLRCK